MKLGCGGCRCSLFASGSVSESLRFLRSSSVWAVCESVHSPHQPGGSGYCCAQVKPTGTLCVLDPCATGGPFACAGILQGSVACWQSALHMCETAGRPQHRTTYHTAALQPASAPCQVASPAPMQQHSTRSHDGSGPHRTNNQPLLLAPATSGAHASTAQHSTRLLLTTTKKLS